MTGRTESGRWNTSNVGHRRRERLLARWRLSTILAAVVALVAVGAVLATAVSLGGFGVPTDAVPQAINPGAVPFGLLSRESPPTVPTTEGRKPRLENPVVVLWFIGPNGHLVSVAAQTTPPVLLQSVLNKLLAGPSTLPAGSAANLQTAIPAGTVVLSAKVVNGLATIDLSPDIESASGEPLIQAFAQLVFTSATATTCPATTRSIKVKGLPKVTPTTAPRNGPLTLPCANRVLFEVNGQRQEVPTATGAQTSHPLTLSDYSSLF